DERVALRRPRPEKLLAGTRLRSKMAESDACGVVCLGDVGNGARLLRDLQAEGKRARLVPGGPPREGMVRHEAALASGKLTRGSPGGQPTHRKSLCLGAKGSEPCVVVARKRLAGRPGMA